MKHRQVHTGKDSTEFALKAGRGLRPVHALPTATRHPWRLWQARTGSG